MLISVVVPNYNHSPYLKARLDSILNQTYLDLELIILDDCSTDNSKGVIESYRNHPRVSHIIYNEQNSGTTFKQWQKGIDLAQGEWIWIAESDDYCEPSFLETLINEISNKKEVVLSYCQSIMFTNDKHIHTKTNWPELSSVLSGKDWVVSEMLGTCNLINASMAIFKKTAIQGLDWSLTNFKLSGDWFFWTQIAAKGDVIVSGKYLNYFRKHIKSASNTPSKSGAYYTEGVKVFHFAIEEFKLTPDEIRIGLVKYVQHFFNNISGIENEEVLKKAWSCIETIDAERANNILKVYEKARNRNLIKDRFMKILSRAGKSIN